MVDTPGVVGDRGVMTKRSPHSFKKRQKEIERKQRAEKKMARRHDKKKRKNAVDAPDAAGRPEEQAEETAG